MAILNKDKMTSRRPGDRLILLLSCCSMDSPIYSGEHSHP